ncbi:MAG: hypothetical protein HY078_03205 [Elusimicrobia bacterium]|nr:hypothetical protein [Elusimicrobiota bacterium]
MKHSIAAKGLAALLLLAGSSAYAEPQISVGRGLYGIGKEAGVHFLRIGTTHGTPIKWDASVYSYSRLKQEYAYHGELKGTGYKDAIRSQHADLVRQSQQIKQRISVNVGDESATERFMNVRKSGIVDIDPEKRTVRIGDTVIPIEAHLKNYQLRVGNKDITLRAQGSEGKTVELYNKLR